MLDAPRSVREVTDHIRAIFDADSLLSDLWITGEVLESTLSRSGHVFFTLAGDGAQIRCVLFRMNALRQRSLPSPGSACVAHGRVEVYATDGTYQFYVDLIEEAGIGLAALELELLRQQLEAEGLFAETRKRPLPRNPKTIGVVTSASGAVWHDIQQVIGRRFPFVQLLLAPATVQGDAAPGAIVGALQSLIEDGRSEIIIIARGGGSVSDLSAFNDETLVRAVFAAPVPVVSAIGHETDWTLIDLVADLRAPTPSAAAELTTPAIVFDLRASLDALVLHADRFERALATHIMDLDRLGTRLDRAGPVPLLSERRSQLEREKSSMSSGVGDILAGRAEKLGGERSRLLASGRSATTQRIERAGRATDLLAALSPTRTLARGYAFVEHRPSGRPVKSVTDVAPGDSLRTRLGDGSVDSVVSSVHSSTNKGISKPV